MPFRLVERRTVWLPTGAGWALLGVFTVLPFIAWWFWAEPFFSLTQREKADVLVVEGWIGGTAIKAASEEYWLGGYKYLVTTGGLTGERWDDRRWNFALVAEEQFRRLGIPPDHLLAAPSKEVDAHRTFQMADSAREALAKAGIRPQAINVFTRGVHTRRSRLVFAKAFGPDVRVGCISWTPPFSDSRWWRSSERAEDLIKETVGYPFELLLSSGAIFSSRR